MKKLLASVSLVVLFALGGCKAASVPVAGAGIDSLLGHHDAAEARLATAAARAIEEGKTEEALLHYKHLYENGKNPIFSPNAMNKDIVLNYAQLLRKTGNAEKAVDIMTPFTQKRSGRDRDDIEPLFANEYAAALIETGEFARAEKIIDRVLEDATAKDFHADAHNLMGITLDAQGKNKDAEPYFRQSLETWKGDPTSVMNNLAMNLAMQGAFDESLTLLRQALVMAPQKSGIAHNIDLVTELRDSVIPKAPVSLKK